MPLDLGLAPHLRRAFSTWSSVSIYSGVDRPRPLQRAAIGLALAVSALPMLAGPVAAHAELASARPAAGTSLIEAPTDVELAFTEEIDPATAVIQLLDEQQGHVGGLGAADVSADGRAAAVRLPDLGPGTYTVSYQVVSAVDGHATAGIYAFVVDPTGTQPPPPVGPVTSSPSVEPATVAARWVALSAILVALGSLAMWWNAGRPVLGREAPGADRRPPWLLIGIASALTFVGLAVYLTLAAVPIVAAIGGGHGGHGGADFPLDFAAPFGWTPFAVAMRVAIVGSAAAFLVSLLRFFSLQDRVVGAGEDRRRALLAAIFLIVALAGMSMAGHAAAYGGPVFGALDLAHLLSVAAWLGALPAALVLARRAGAGRSQALRGLLHRHGRLAILAAPVTALTGLANSPIVLGAPRDLVATDYGNLILAKVVLLSVALGMGAANHLALRSRARLNVPALIGIDLVVAILAVLVAATMVTIPPAAARQPVLVTPPRSPVHLYGTAGPSSVHTAVSLAAPGRQTYQVTITGVDDGGPRDDVQKVFLTFVPPAADLSPERVELTRAERPGLYVAMGAYTPLEGTWSLEVTVRRAGALDEMISFELPVAEPDAPELVPPPSTGVDVPAPLAIVWGVLPVGPAAWLPALLAAAAIGVTAWWARRPRAPRWLWATRVALLAVVAVTGLGAGSRALVTAANAPGATAIEENPLPADTRSVARGERLYRANCAICHGIDGAGDGPLITFPQAGPLANAIRTSSDGDLSYRIAVGVAGTPMPAFAGVLSRDDRWHLLNYLRDRWDP